MNEGVTGPFLLLKKIHLILIHFNGRKDSKYLLTRPSVSILKEKYSPETTWHLFLPLKKGSFSKHLTFLRRGRQVEFESTYSWCLLLTLFWSAQFGLNC